MSALRFFQNRANRTESQIFEIFVLISIRDWIAHLLSERLQKLKPEVTPTYALICKRRHNWMVHRPQKRIVIEESCLLGSMDGPTMRSELLYFTVVNSLFSHIITKQTNKANPFYLIYENYNCTTVKYSESGTIQHGTSGFNFRQQMLYPVSYRDQWIFSAFSGAMLREDTGPGNKGNTKNVFCFLNIKRIIKI